MVVRPRCWLCRCSLMPLLLLLWIRVRVVCTRLVGGAFLALAALKGCAMAAVVPKPLCSGIVFLLTHAARCFGVKDTRGDSTSTAVTHHFLISGVPPPTLAL